MSDFKIVSGTFLDGMASDIPSNNFTADDWRKQFDVFKEMGIDTVVFIRVGCNDSAMYRSPVMNTTLYEEPDLLEQLLAEADRTGIKAWMGLFDTGKYWIENEWDREVEVNSRLIDEACERYLHHPSFHGWYISHEGDMSFHPERTWKPMCEKMKSVTPDKPILVSPRYCGIKYGKPNPHPISPEQHYKHFDYLWDFMGGLISYAAFMDGHVHFHELEAYVQATKEVCDKHHIEFWSNLETFDRDMPWRFPPIEWMKMRHKLEVVQPYAEKVITFEAPHFLSPLSLYPSANGLYKRYMQYLREKGALA